jgi:hypothetical protein
MSARCKVSAAGLLAGWMLLLGAPVAAQPSSDADEPGTPALRARQAMVLMDYQVVPVKGDKAIDLLGMHVHNQVNDWLYLGAGLSAPLLHGAYGGFALFDVAAHARKPLGARLFATAGLAAGGGGGGRSVENVKVLTGAGSFVKAYVGLGYDFGAFSLGSQVSRMKFKRSAIGGTQADVFLEIPYSYYTGPFASHGQRLAPGDARQAAEASSERMLSLAFDNFWQEEKQPRGSHKGSFNIVDLQYAQYFAADSYWFAALGVGYRGLPLSNQALGGLGQRLRISPRLSVYGQLGIGSGIYAPEVIDTGPGLLLYPKLAAEYALSKDLGLAVSAGYLAAPKGSSRNMALGISLTRYLRGAGDGAGGGVVPSYQAYRVSLFQETDRSIRYRDLDRGQVRMLGIQADAIIDEHFFIPLRGAAAYSTYLGYAGYAELLAGMGVQTRLGRGDRLQAFAQLMAGTNVHGLALKGGAGLRYGLSDRVALHLNLGHIVARSAAGNRFDANSVSVGMDYLFSLPAW